MAPTRWHPWRALRERPTLELRWALLPPGSCGGRLEDRLTGRTVVLDRRLDRRSRSATLAHELVHDERGILYPPGTPAALVRKEEAAVDRIVVDRLVPRHELIRLVSARAELGPVLADEIADEFDVPVTVARRALERLRQQSGAAALGYADPGASR